MDKRLLSQYIVKNSEQPDEELRELFDEFKEHRIDERGEYASSVAKIVHMINLFTRIISLIKNWLTMKNF